MSSYEISEKIMTVVSDNASNMTNAFDFSLPGNTTDKADETTLMIKTWLTLVKMLPPQKAH